MTGCLLLAAALATIITVPLWGDNPAWRRGVDRESELLHERVRRERAERERR